jgi:hypothetical protein
MVGEAGEQGKATSLALAVGFGPGDEFGKLTFFAVRTNEVLR